MTKFFKVFKVKIMILTEDYLLKKFFIKFSDCSILMEAITPEQKEKGQRVMNQKAIEPFEKIRNYLVNKWKNRRKTKEDYKKKKEEFLRYNIIIELLKDNKLESKKTKDADNYVKNITGEKPKIITYKNKNFSGLVADYQGLPKLVLRTEVDEYSNGLKFSNLEKKEIRENIRKFIIYHEYGHLYEFLKNFIETGKAEIIDTQTARPSEVIDNEGKANAYAIDNMYRKDRRELLKNSEPDENNQYSKRYYNGLKKHSKTYQKIKDSIEKEKSYFDY